MKKWEAETKAIQEQKIREQAQVRHLFARSCHVNIRLSSKRSKKRWRRTACAQRLSRQVVVRISRFYPIRVAVPGKLCLGIAPHGTVAASPDPGCMCVYTCCSASARFVAGGPVQDMLLLGLCVHALLGACNQGRWTSPMVI
eukprot:458-Pelagomonas_calceolata.AAC.1